jgi:hypothetical protein
VSNTPAEEQPGKAPRLPGGRLTYERGIRYSSLPAPSRHLALTLATWADVDTGIIPDRFQPAKGVLEEATGLSRGAIVKHLNLLEEEGWISRETGGGAGRRTKFSLRVPAGAKTGHQATPSAPENGSPHDPFTENGSPREQKTGHVVNKNGSPGDPKSPSSPYQYPPPPGGGGGTATNDRLQAVAEFLERLPGRWAQGRASARRLAPLLLEAIDRQGWDLDDTLAAKLTEDRGPVERHSGALKFRIEDLPKKPTAPTDPVAPRLRVIHQPCGCCGRQAPAATTHNERPYCDQCTTPCTSCWQLVPTDQLHQDQCLTCLPIHHRTAA